MSNVRKGPIPTEERFAMQARDCARRMVHVLGLVLCPDCGAEEAPRHEEHRSGCVFIVEDSDAET